MGLGAAMALIALLLAVTASSAGAFAVTKWEAGTCKSTVESGVAGNCTYASSPNRFFTQAAGHPKEGLTDFAFETGGLLGAPVGNVRKVRVDLPEGLNVNPLAVPRCAKATFEANPASCAASQVGESIVTSISSILPVPLSFPVYDLIPGPGEPALFAFNANVPLVVDADIYLQTELEWAGDYHEAFTINNIPNNPPLVENRLVFDGTKGGTFITNPSPCNGPTTTTLGVESYEGQQINGIKTTPPAKVDGCTAVPFKPVVTATANGAPTDSPANISATLAIPQGTQPINSSTVNKVSATLPRGAGLNPATAPGLEFCPNKNFPLKSKVAPTCPPKSQIGTVSIEAPAIPAGSLKGPVYLAPQESRVPTSGKEFRVFLDAVSTTYGVQVRLEGKVSADPATGQLTATFEGAPQISFSSVTLNFSGTPTHPIPPLSSPPTCNSAAISQITPWSTLKPVATPATNLTLTTAPNKQPCAKMMAERPFTPAVSAHPATSQVLTYTPYQLQIVRTDGQQEIKGLNVTLPPGATAKLAGVPYCPPTAIAAAAGKSGKEESAKPSCPGESKIGIATILAGTGNSPLKIEGKAYLAGPYKGAPLSIAVITPAVAGPFDLGVVVVRAPLNLNPVTAQIEASAEIPDVFGGAKLDIKSIAVLINRKEFTLNGTNCRKSAVTSTIAGGGADPTNPATWSAAPFSEFARGNSCKALKFKPQLHLRLFGATNRNKHPKLRAALVTKEGQANLARASVALPHAIFLDQSSLGSICTRVQFAAEQCPKKSIYGHARAFSPLLAQPLEGPVYLRSSNHTLPDMVADLQGQVSVVLDARIDSYKGGIRTTFQGVPDVPVSKFVLTLPGGKHGLLINSTNLCAKPVKGIIQLKGQNSRRSNRHQRIQTPCSGKHKKKGKHETGAHNKKHAKSKGGKQKGKKNKGGNKKGSKGKKS